MEKTANILHPAVKSFLKDWLSWVDRGAINFAPYQRRDSLCLALVDFIDTVAMENVPISLVEDELHEAFEGSGHQLPLQWQLKNWAEEHEECAAHLNQACLAWVRKQVNG